MKRNADVAFYDSDEADAALKEEEDEEDEEEEDSNNSNKALAIVGAPQQDQEELRLAQEASPFFQYLSKLPEKKFRFITSQSAKLATMGASFASLFDKMSMQITKDGIVGTCFNGSRTVMARWVMKVDQIVEGLFCAPEEPQEIIFDVHEFANDLAAVSKSDIVCISLNDDKVPTQLIIDSNEDKSTGHIRMQLNASEDEEVLQIPSIEYSNRIVLTSDEFNRKLHLKTDAKRVTFSLTDKEFGLKMKSMRNEINFAWPVNAESDILSEAALQRIVSPQDFMLNDILNVVRITKATKYVDISMPEVYDANKPGITKPLLINYSFLAGTVSFFIAPMANSDDYDI